MKCDKCGFVSFDHLAECRRCGADLEPTRERLGFSSLKSEVPFLLGSLLKRGGRQETAGAGYGGEPGDFAPDHAAASESEPSFEVEPFPSSPAGSAEVEATGDRSAKEDLIIELSEEDLESFAGAKGSLRPRVPGKPPDNR